MHADCINTPGSHYCRCHKGFEDPPFPEMMCSDIDECTDPQLKPCDVHAMCHNNPGSYTCTCITGYIGDGVTCLPVPDKPQMSPVEYKGLGIHGSEWMVIELQPHVTKTYLKDLKPDSTYLVRVGAFSIFNTSIYSDEKLFKTSPVAKASATDSTAGNESQNTIVIAVALVVSIVCTGNHCCYTPLLDAKEEET
ncbi:Fibrillin 3 [Desmophyllum pertusum]|uniref:Fibrillin 3 n=1 Tax=Desmophyllum pertusum TaxID=174260 RepID=A0A9W9YBC4_9CNID|nr:Fibrillin 3 [Desmophyllum pertusum]